ALAVTLAPASADAGVAISVSVPGIAVVAGPPAHVPMAVPSLRPSHRHVWVPAHWTWRGARGYEWAPGYWVIPPVHTVGWVPGYWATGARGHVWVDGHWGPR